MENILYIASLNTKKHKYDGERIKSTMIFDVVKKKYKTTCINLSRNKIFNTLRIFFVGAFKKKKYDAVIISKDPHGANLIIEILRLTRFPISKVFYFEIGPFLYDRILNGSIKKKTFDDIKIIVETDSMKDELESINVRVYDVFPNFKHIVDVPFLEQKYPKETLKLIYFSRIDEMKGIYDLMETVSDLNCNRICYELDLYGVKSFNFDEKRFKELLKVNRGIVFRGKIDLNSVKEYLILAKYDLHVFPTKYSEGFPGSIIDFFIAGVPTLSSTFERAHDILNEKDSFFFEKGSKESLKKQLEFIYEHQELLLEKRLESYKRRYEFSTNRFSDYLENLFED